MTADTIRAVVVTYKTRDLVIPLLRDLLSELASWPGSEVVVVDNMSDDGTVEAIAAAFPEIRLEPSPTNLGFGAAVNLAAKEATSRWLLLVNPDARIDAGSVGRLVDVAVRDPEHGLYGGRFVDVRRQTAEDSVAVVPTLPNLVGFALGTGAIARRLGWRSAPRRAAASSEPTTVDALPGTFLLIETDAWREIGGFDERYFMYSEDLDLSLRIGRTGRRPMYVPAASIQHAGGASSSSGQKEVLKLTSLVTLLRGQWPGWRARVGEGLLLLGIGVRRLTRLRARTPDGRWETAWRERAGWRSGW